MAKYTKEQVEEMQHLLNSGISAQKASVILSNKWHIGSRPLYQKVQYESTKLKKLKEEKSNTKKYFITQSQVFGKPYVIYNLSDKEFSDLVAKEQNERLILSNQ